MEDNRTGNMLRKWRENAELSQGDLAEKMGYSSPQIVSNWERGICIVPPKKAALFCKATGAKQKDLHALILKDTSKRMEQRLAGLFASSAKKKSSRPQVKSTVEL